MIICAHKHTHTREQTQIADQDEAGGGRDDDDDDGEAAANAKQSGGPMLEKPDHGGAGGKTMDKEAKAGLRECVNGLAQSKRPATVIMNPACRKCLVSVHK